jgi:hypothetical protein
MKALPNQKRESEDFKEFHHNNGYTYGTKYTEMMQKTHKQVCPLSRKTGICTGSNMVCFLHRNELSFSIIVLDRLGIIWLYSLTIE